MSLLSASQVYENASRLCLTYHIVSYKKFQSFVLSLKLLKSLLADLADDNDWKDFLYPLQKYQFEQAAAPIAFNGNACSPDVEALKKHLWKCKTLYPGLYLPANEVLDRYIELSCCAENPLLPLLFKLLNGDSYTKTVVVLRESRMIPPVEQLLSANELARRAKVVTSVQLRDLQTYSKMIIIGLPAWFPEYIFSAPRSTETHILHYNWVKSKWRPLPVFPGSSGALVTLEEHTYTEDGIIDIEDEDEAETVDPKEVLTPFNWVEVSRNIRREYAVYPHQECVEARLLLLEGRTLGVLLDSESKAFVIDLQEETSSKVARVMVTDIEPEMFVLLRTSGGGDYIATLADRLLGANAASVRDRQRAWKTLLRRTVSNSGLQSMSRLLTRHGSQRAQNELNIRNWMSQETIRPRDNEDFDAILRSVGLINRRLEFYEAASRLDSAHRTAGKQIRELLLKKVLSSDLTRLEQMGRMDFELSSANGGSMTAFRVVEIAPQTFRVPLARLSHTFTI